MQGNSAFDELIKNEHRYAPEAYEFVMDALAYTVDRNDERRHVTGHELLYGIRDLALDSWGLMARHVLRSWGVKSTDDLGKIVFNMVKAGILSKNQQDTPDDFKNVYGFADAFEKSYSPEFDENGHVRRKLPLIPPGEQFSWLSLFGETGFN